MYYKSQSTRRGADRFRIKAFIKCFRSVFNGVLYDMLLLGKSLLCDRLHLRGRFVKEIGEAGLSDSRFGEIISLLDRGIPVGLGRDHSLSLVGYERDATQEGGGIMIFRNSYGTNQRQGYEEESVNSIEDKPTYQPWYSDKFDSVCSVMEYFCEKYSSLYNCSKLFSEGLLNCNLPEAIIEAIAANLPILKSPTVLRQTDGRLWAWEGIFDKEGSCHGSCTHVWNYQQALYHLFPDLERSLRITEFNENQDERGHQEFRASLPIRKSGNRYHAASDGQLGEIMKMYREWRICGDDTWVESNWDKMVSSINYCINTWDKKHEEY